MAFWLFPWVLGLRAGRGKGVLVYPVIDRRRRHFGLRDDSIGWHFDLHLGTARVWQAQLTRMAFWPSAAALSAVQWNGWPFGLDSGVLHGRMHGILASQALSWLDSVDGEWWHSGRPRDLMIPSGCASSVPPLQSSTAEAIRTKREKQKCSALGAVQGRGCFAGTGMRVAKEV